MFIIKDKNIKSILNNAVIVFSGDILTSILNLIGMLIIVKILGFNDYGIFILIQSIILFFDTLLNFQSWQAYIKFYPTFKLNRKKTKEIIKFSFILDLLSALIGALAVVALSEKIIIFFNLSNEFIFYIKIYSLVILFNIRGTCTGILRTTNNFKKLRNQRAIEGILKFILTILLFLKKGNITEYIYLNIITSIMGSVILFYYTHIILKKEGLLDYYNEKLKLDIEYVKFVLRSNINSSLDLPIAYIDTFFASRFLSLEVLGIYKFIKSLTAILDKLARPIFQSCYPEFSEYIENREYRKSFSIFKGLVKLKVILGIIFFILFNLVYSLINKYTTVNLLKFKLEVNLFLIIKIITVSFTSMHPLFLSIGKIKEETKIILIANVFYIGASYILVQKLSMIGLIISILLQVLIIILSKLIIVLGFFKKEINYE